MVRVAQNSGCHFLIHQKFLAYWLFGKPVLKVYLEHGVTIKVE